MKKIVIIITLLFVSVISQSFYQNGKSNTSIENGKTVYTIYCMSCHMENGQGQENTFPSLVNTGNLNDKNKLVKIILQGMRGPIVVKGKKFNTEMAAILISDQETADVINYIRNSWGNKAPLMKASDVPLAKKAVVKGYQPF